MMRALVLLSGIAAAASANAAEVAVANFVPGSIAHAGTVVVGDAPPRPLAYATHVRITLAAGTHHLRFDIDGKPAAAADVTVDADDLAVVALTGAIAAPVVMTYDDASLEAALGLVPRTALGRHHLALGEVAASNVTSEYQCFGLTDETSGAAALASGESAWIALPREGSHECAASFSHAAIGELDVSALAVASGDRRHVFLIGDGQTAEYRVYTIGSGLGDDGGIDFSPGPSSPAPAVASLLQSSTFWVDRERDLEGVSLFEIPGAGTIYGTWFGFEPDGRAAWLALDGGIVYGAARRDIKVYEVSHFDGATRLDRVGSGTLQYTDCNHAVLRLFLRGVELRTLNLERSRPVDFCVALDKFG